jgi:lysophospholipase L1-like esterase
MKKLLVTSLFLNLLAIVFFVYTVKRLGGIGYLRYLFRNQGVAAWYEHRHNQFKYLPLDSTDIVFLGNSITHQGEWAELLGDLKYKNRGISGDVIERVRTRLPEITRYRPAGIVLLIGINDLLFHPPATVARQYESLVKDIIRQSPDTKIYVQSVLPVNNEVKETNVKNSDIEALNAEIMELAMDNGIVFIDIHTLLKDKNGHLDARFTSDGIHLNGLAYRLWADKLHNDIGL